MADSRVVPKFDYHTAENSRTPHVKVYNVETEQTVAVFYILGESTPATWRAESYAEKFIEQLEEESNNA